MALTQEDLQAIAELTKIVVKGELEPINNRLDGIDNRLDKVDSRLDTMQDSINTLKQDMAHHNHYVEPLLKAVKDGINGLQERNRQPGHLEDKVDGHDHRIWALEQSAKAI